MPIIFYLLITLIVTPITIYFYFFFRRVLTLFKIEKKTKKSRMLAALLALTIAVLCVIISNFGFIILFYFFIMCIVIDLVNFFLKRIPVEKFQRAWTFLYKSGIVCLLITVSALTYGHFNIHNVQATEYTVEGSKAVSENMKIIQISDLHTGTVLSDQEMAECFDRIQKEKADLLVLTGDIFDETTTLEQMETTVDMLSRIKTTYGIYYIFGNHDVNQYIADPAYTADQLKGRLIGAGIKVLEDDVTEITDGFTVIGRLDASVEKRQSIERLVSQAPSGDFLLLLDHQPVDLEENAKAGINLELAGHTHGGQIWPMGILSKLAGINEEYYGIHTIGNFKVIVSSGIAGWGFPVRTAKVSEYVIINILKAA